MPSPTTFVGVDGGGSRCRVRVADAHGRTRAEAEAGAANVYNDFDTACATIASAVEGACAEAGVALAEAHLALGLAGASAPAIAARVADRLRFGASCRVVSDAVIACLGAHAGRDGGLVIAGTGSGALLRRDGVDLAIGGRGFMLGDDGSGATIGRQAWRQTLRAYDGLGPWTPLLRTLMAQHGDDIAAVTGWARTAGSRDFAAYAPAVMAAARAGDGAAIAIAAEAGRAIGELVQALAGRGAPRIALVGGLAAPLRPFLPEAARARLSPPLLDALDGALLLAGAPVARTGEAASASRLGETANADTAAR